MEAALIDTDDYNYSQRQRLEFIDFCLYFTGAISRALLMQRFEISSAAATRDLALYKGGAPQNVHYDQKQKEYFLSSNFAPAYDHDLHTVLNELSKYFSPDGFNLQSILCESPIEINRPELSILATITRTIYQNKPVQIRYCSLDSGESEREIVPFALVNSSTRWHVRGYDRKHKRFTDFVINRIKNASLIEEGTIDANEKKDADIQWNRIVEMEIIPHPGLSESQKKAIAYEYKMKDGVLKINIRAATAGYFLRRWNVDCTKDHALKKDDEEKNEYHLWLKNHLSLYGVESAIFAPGYSSPE